MEVFNREKVNIGNEKIPPIIQISTDFYIDNLRITIKSVLICVIGGIFSFPIFTVSLLNTSI